MNNPRITLLGSQAEALRSYLQSHPAGHERAAIVLFRRLHRPVDGLASSDRYIAVEVHPFQDDWVVDSSPSHFRFELKHLRDLFRRCEEECLVFGFVHNHPTGFPDFSDTDGENERTLLRALTNRNGPVIHFVALLWTKGTWKARVRSGEAPDTAQAARHVLTLTQPLQMFGFQAMTEGDSELFARQAAAFGRPFVDMLKSLRVGVVGAGGTGSPTVTLLARAGVGELIVVDNDALEQSNLNRVRGARLADVGKNKARILNDFIRSLQLPTKIVGFDALIDTDASAIDAISSCDVVFGCTDDQIGREVLNTALYVYAQVYIDVGLGGHVDEDNEGRPYLKYHYGRISTILPEHGECLFCQGVIKDVWIRHQYALREKPSMTPGEARDRYLDGGGEQAPGVGPFTSAIADYGVATLFDLLKPFRKFPDELRRDFFKIDFVRMELRSSQERRDPDCAYCSQKQYLLVQELSRLNRPQLGKADASN
jgi:molybdopterin/thiamine biosynthesis adenylyltransferase